jgi:hypothetical protein
MPSAVVQHFHRQAAYCTQLGSPLTAAILTAMAGQFERAAPPGWAAPLLDWPGDPGADALALRVAGALHRAVLDGDAELAVAYAARRVDEAAIDAAFARHPALLPQYLQGPPQTNDPLRAAVLLGGFLEIAAACGARPLALREIGASAGINLLWDRFAYDFGNWCRGDPMAAPLLLAAEWQGAPPPQAAIAVHSRAGCDIRPLDARDPEQRKRLLSYIWADQWPRLERVAKALELAALAGPPEAITAGAFVARELAARPRDAAFVLYHSIVWQYVDAAERDDIAAAMAAAGAQATPDAPLAWLRFEPGPATRDGAALSLTLWPGGATRQLAVADYHGRWVRWSG